MSEDPRITLEWLGGVLSGMAEDLDAMKRFHPPSKRGSNYTRALESLERRLAGALGELGNGKP